MNDNLIPRYMMIKNVNPRITYTNMYRKDFEKYKTKNYIKQASKRITNYNRVEYKKDYQKVDQFKRKTYSHNAEYKINVTDYLKSITRGQTVKWAKDGYIAGYNISKGFKTKGKSTLKLATQRMMLTSEKSITSDENISKGFDYYYKFKTFYEPAKYIIPTVYNAPIHIKNCTISTVKGMTAVVKYFKRGSIKKPKTIASKVNTRPIRYKKTLKNKEKLRNQIMALYSVDLMAMSNKQFNKYIKNKGFSDEVIGFLTAKRSEYKKLSKRSKYLNKKRHVRSTTIKKATMKYLTSTAGSIDEDKTTERIIYNAKDLINIGKNASNAGIKSSKYVIKKSPKVYKSAKKQGKKLWHGSKRFANTVKNIKNGQISRYINRNNLLKAEKNLKELIKKVFRMIIKAFIKLLSLASGILVPVILVVVIATTVVNAGGYIISNFPILPHFENKNDDDTSIQAYVDYGNDLMTEFQDLYFAKVKEAQKKGAVKEVVNGNINNIKEIISVAYVRNDNNSDSYKFTKKYIKYLFDKTHSIDVKEKTIIEKKTEYITDEKGNKIPYTKEVKKLETTISVATISDVNGIMQTDGANTLSSSMLTGSKGDFLGKFELTAYDASVADSEGYGTMSASGRRLQPNLSVAVDKSKIPLGTNILIKYPLTGCPPQFAGKEIVYRADDVGGAVKGNVIDVYFEPVGYYNQIGFGRVRGAEVYLAQDIKSIGSSTNNNNKELGYSLFNYTDPAFVSKKFKWTEDNIQIANNVAKSDWTQIYPNLKMPVSIAGGSSTVADLSTYSTIPDNLRVFSKYSGTILPGNTSPKGQCVWYVYNRIYEVSGIKLYSLGDGGIWAKTASARGYSIKATPQPGYAYSTQGGSYGHIMFVEAVNEDGSFYVSEFNYVYLKYSERLIKPVNGRYQGQFIDFGVRK